MFSPELSHGKWSLGAKTKADQLRRLFKGFWRKMGREREREERETEREKEGKMEGRKKGGRTETEREVNFDYFLFGAIADKL